MELNQNPQGAHGDTAFDLGYQGEDLSTREEQALPALEQDLGWGVSYESGESESTTPDPGTLNHMLMGSGTDYPLLPVTQYPFESNKGWHLYAYYHQIMLDYDTSPGIPDLTQLQALSNYPWL